MSSAYFDLYDRRETPFGFNGLNGAAGQIVPTAVSGIGATLTPVIAHSIFAGAAGAAMPAFAIPVVGAAIFGVTLALTAILNRKGPQQKVAATQAVEKVIKLMQDNLDAYMSGPRDANTQTMAMVNFDQAVAWLRSDQGCGNPALGDAGVRCITERDRGGIYDFYATLRDPIANDTHPAELAAQVQASGGDGPLSFLAPGGSSIPVPLLIGGALLVAAFMTSGGK